MIDNVAFIEGAFLATVGIFDRWRTETLTKYANAVSNYKINFPLVESDRKKDPKLPPFPYVDVKEYRIYSIERDAFYAAYDRYDKELRKHLDDNGPVPAPFTTLDNTTVSYPSDALAGWTPEGPAVPVPAMPIGGWMGQNDAGQDLYGVENGAQGTVEDGMTFAPLDPDPAGPELTAYKRVRWGGVITAYWTKTRKGSKPWPQDPALNTPDALKNKAPVAPVPSVSPLSAGPLARK